jgi:hypothetical protein
MKPTMDNSDNFVTYLVVAIVVTTQLLAAQITPFLMMLLRKKRQRDLNPRKRFFLLNLAIQLVPKPVLDKLLQGESRAYMYKDYLPTYLAIHDACRQA